MDGLTSPNSLNARFQEEYASTMAYVELLTKRLSLFASDLDKIINDLVMFGLLERDHGLPRPTWHQPYSVSELRTVSVALVRTKQSVEVLFNAWRSQVEQMQEDQAFTSIPVRTYDGEIVDFVVEAYGNLLEIPEEDTQVWFDDLRNQIQQEVEEYGDESQFFERDIDEVLAETFKYAI